jgi:hypothetical protein
LRHKSSIPSFPVPEEEENGEMIVVESPAPKKGGRKGKKGEVVDLGLGAELGFEGQAEMEEEEGWEKVSLDFESLPSFCAVMAGGLTRAFRSDGETDTFEENRLRFFLPYHAYSRSSLFLDAQEQIKVERRLWAGLRIAQQVHPLVRLETTG